MATRPGGDKRGGSKDRRRAKHNLLHIHGNGHTAPCSWCGTDLDFDSIERDRIIPGGSYALRNTVPACRGCNVTRLHKPFIVFLAECGNPQLALNAFHLATGRQLA